MFKTSLLFLLFGFITLPLSPPAPSKNNTGNDLDLASFRAPTSETRVPARRNAYCCKYVKIAQILAIPTRAQAEFIYFYALFIWLALNG